MVIGILTYHNVCNFGANLQTLSTVEFLRRCGHDPKVINWSNPELDLQYKASVTESQFNEHKRFIELHFPLTRQARSDYEIAQIIAEENIEAIIVGSDAVAQHHPWLSRIVFPTRKIIQVVDITPDRVCPNQFWGSFLKYVDKDLPMAMMSVSSQNSAFKLMSRKEIIVMNECLSKFSYISTRDDWTAKMIKYVTGGRIIPDVTPDPVFAFNNNVGFVPTWNEIRERFQLPEKYILLSFLNSRTVSKEWLSEFEQICEQHGIKCYALPFPSGIHFNNSIKQSIQLPLSPLDWYSLIKYSQGYVGNNMHPIVVSLHNGVPCFSFDNYGIRRLRVIVNEKTSKIYHIMKSFNLLDNRRACSKLFERTVSPQIVFEKLQEFDREKVKEQSDLYYKNYLRMMSSILDSFVE